MERVLDSFRELVTALGLQEKAMAIETDARALLEAHDRAVADEDIAGQRPENKALAICYIAANYVLLPERISYEAMTRAAAATSTWRSEPVPGKNGMTKLVKRFAKRICPIEHDPVIIEKNQLVFMVCARCHYMLRTCGKPGAASEPVSEAGSEADLLQDSVPAASDATSHRANRGRGGLVGIDTGLLTEPVKKPSRKKKPELSGETLQVAETGVQHGVQPGSDTGLQKDAKNLIESSTGTKTGAAEAAASIAGMETGADANAGIDAGVNANANADVNADDGAGADVDPDADIDIDLDMIVEESGGNADAGTGLPGAPDVPVSAEIRKKWLASALVLGKKVIKERPVLKPALPGAMVLLKRSIDAYITSEKVLGSLLLKVVKMALLHEGKMQNLPITTKDLNIPPSDYLKFLAASSTTVARPTTTDDAALVERALAIIAAYSRKPVDDETRQRITRFQEVARRKLMGFSPVMAAAVIAFIDIARHDTSVVLSKVASLAGTNTSSLYNATGRFLEKIGRPGDPGMSLNERVAAAFPPRAK